MVIEVSATLVANITRRRPGFFDAFWLNLNFFRASEKQSNRALDYKATFKRANLNRLEHANLLLGRE